MGVNSYTAIQYTFKCDGCGIEEVCCDGAAESVHSKQQAIKWACMHKTKNEILCDECFKYRSIL